MTRILLDANLSPRTANFLTERFEFDVVALSTLGLSYLNDFEVIAQAKVKSRILVTFDVGFGRLFHRYERGQVGIIVLRLADQSVASANQALERFFADPKAQTIALERSLVMIDEARFRVTTEP